MLLRDQPPRPPIRGLETLIGQCTPPEVKQLTESDIKDSQARLSLPKPYGRESIKPLLTPDEDVEKGIPVTAYDADGERFEMKLKLWANRKVYVLTSGWKPFAKAHGLRHHEDFVTIWVFRKLDTGNLCVAITSRRLPVYWALKRSRPPAIQ
ncbi:unnamed protein product [Linum tenue]|nr:unnamed protein product [Linum tenue]CAI0628724.1 unnamed protein product [Linum tenue]